VIIEGIPALLETMKAQIVILGRGNNKYETALKIMASKYKGCMAVSNDFDEKLAHLIYAGCDMFLMPSRYEPCGLGQLIAMRYGAIPIVRHTGGLVDTVLDVSTDLSVGTGFVFKQYTVNSMLKAIKRAIREYKHKSKWQKMMKRVMSQDFSWRSSAKKYEGIYKRLEKQHKDVE
jgi:starch synthase